MEPLQRRPLEAIAAVCDAPDRLIERHLLNGVAASLIIENRVPRASGTCGCGKRFAMTTLDRLLVAHSEHVNAEAFEYRRLQAADYRTQVLAQAARDRQPLSDLIPGDPKDDLPPADVDAVAFITGRRLHKASVGHARRALRRWAKKI